MTVFLECLPDETLAASLGVAKKAIVHTDDKGRVCHNLAKNRGVIGMVDEDPLSAQPTYMKTLSEISYEDDIRVLLDKERQNKMVVVCPRFENWLIKTAKQTNVKMADFGLSENPHELHSVINQRLD